jgi:hypothetical protein
MNDSIKKILDDINYEKKQITIKKCPKMSIPLAPEVFKNFANIYTKLENLIDIIKFQNNQILCLKDRINDYQCENPEDSDAFCCSKLKDKKQKITINLRGLCEFCPEQFSKNRELYGYIPYGKLSKGEYYRICEICEKSRIISGGNPEISQKKPLN